MEEELFIHKDISCELLLTTKCNLSCTYCIAHDLDSMTMDLDCGEKAIDMFVALGEGATNIEFIFTGGEPLLNLTTLEALVPYAENKSMEFKMNPLFVVKTNGTLINEDVVTLFKRYAVKAVISIDGLPEYHNQNRKSGNGNSTQETIVNNIIKLQNHGITCSASLTVHPSFAKDIIHNVKYLYNIGLREIDIGPVYGKMEWSKSQITDFKRSLELCAEFIRQTSENENIEIGPLYKNTEHVGDKLTDCWGCKAGLNNLAFMPNGKISGCSSLAMLTNKFPWLIIGNIEEGVDSESLQYLFNNSQASEESRSSCTSCKTKNNCTGGCIAINLSTTKSSLIPPNFYCEIISAISAEWERAWG